MLMAQAAVPAQHRPVIVIPAYQPSRSLPDLVRELAESDVFAAILVVNDGSSPESAAIFDELRAIAQVAVLDHVVNLGKGAALKTGLNFAACKFPTAIGIVTADADGQHTLPDIMATAEALAANPRALVLGVRQFEGEVPIRSKFGNALTRSIMRAVIGQNLDDTQTGLRGIPMNFVPQLLRTRAMGYDFELDMLVQCKYSGRRIAQVPVSTVYIDQNRSSHFNPLLDSMRIYFVFVRFAAVSLVTAAIDNVIFLVALRFSTNLLVCMAAGRLAACTFNYLANKRGVFHSKTQTAVALPKYWLSVVLAGALSYIVIHGLVTYTSMQVVPAKVLTESVMFVLSFIIQRDFVFSQRPIENAG